VAHASHHLACSYCFKNVGVSIEAKKIGELDSQECPRCKARQGLKLGKEELWTLQQKFFLAGSQPTAYYPSPIGLGGAALSPAEFEPNTWADYVLLKELTGVPLFW
jgi:hypothetical protein